MVEIPIERKRGGGWLWSLLGIAVLALLAWWLLADGDRRTASDGDVAPPVVSTASGAAAAYAAAGTPAGTTAGAPVADFLAWVDETRPRGEAGVDHEYVAAGITRLAGAIGDLASRDSLGGSAVPQQVQALDRLATQVQQDRDATSHADVVHAAFESSAALLADIQRRHVPAAASAVAELRDAATAVAKDRPLLEQKAQVGRFFDRAATAVRAMRAGG